jgi:hypothetical protein
MPELADMTPAELYAACTAVSLVSRLGTYLGPVPPVVDEWLTEVATTMAAEIARR